MTSQEVEKRQI